MGDVKNGDKKWPLSIGMKTDNKIEPIALKKGATGDAVKNVQAILKNKFGYELVVDGDFGPKTESAVKSFQLTHQLKPDGIIGPKTMAVLYSQKNDGEPVKGEPERQDSKLDYIVPTIIEVDVKVPTHGKYKTANKKALGCVVHYTAGRFTNGKDGAISTLRYLASQGLGCLVMDQEGIIYKAKNQDWDDFAYHAGSSQWKGKTGISAYCMGMEIMNAGVLEKKGNQYYSWFGQELGEHLVRHVDKKDNMKAGFYHRYTDKQEGALIDFLLWQIDTQGMQIDWIIGHDECAPTRKSDPGGSLSMTMPQLRALLKQKLAVK